MAEATPEHWRPVPGYEGVYEVSDLGRVRSLPRTGQGRWGPRVYPGMIRTLQLDPKGYWRVQLKLNGQMESWLVHRLVLGAFRGPCPPGEESLHGDGDTSNCWLTNLRWGTQSENNHDRVRHGTHHNAIRTTCRPGGHKLFPPNLLPSNDGSRRCRTCELARNRARYRSISKGTPEWDVLLAACYREVMGA